MRGQDADADDGDKIVVSAWPTPTRGGEGRTRTLKSDRAGRRKEKSGKGEETTGEGVVWCAVGPSFVMAHDGRWTTDCRVGAVKGWRSECLCSHRRQNRRGTTASASGSFSRAENRVCRPLQLRPALLSPSPLATDSLAADRHRQADASDLSAGKRHVPTSNNAHRSTWCRVQWVTRADDDTRRPLPSLVFLAGLLRPRRTIFHCNASISSHLSTAVGYLAVRIGRWWQPEAKATGILEPPASSIRQEQLESHRTIGRPPRRKTSVLSPAALPHFLAISIRHASAPWRR